MDNQQNRGRTAESPSPPLPSVFKHRAFTLFWSAHMFSTLAVQAESVTIGWQVYAIARHTRNVEQSALMVGMVGLVQFVPLFALSLIGGATADRCDRRVILLNCTAVEIACALSLAALSFSSQPSSGLLPIFLIAALFGASRAFLSPASGAMGPMLVPREALPNAISWNSLGDQAGSVIGPWIGGALCAVSPAVAYAGSAILYVVAAGALLFIRASTCPEFLPGSRLEQIREGIAYVWTNKIVWGAISLDLFAVLLGGATALLPVFASDVLKVGPHGFGVLRSGPAIGAMAMAFALSRWPLHRRAGRWMFAGRGGIRCGYADLRRVQIHDRLGDRTGRDGGGRHDLCLRAADPGANRNPRCDAWPRVGSLRPVHWSFGGIGRLRDRSRCSPDRTGSRGDLRRHWVAGRYRGVVPDVPGFAQGGPTGRNGGLCYGQ